jgi:hypothetical protein
MVQAAFGLDHIRNREPHVLSILDGSDILKRAFRSRSGDSSTGITTMKKQYAAHIDAWAVQLRGYFGVSLIAALYLWHDIGATRR